MKRFVLDGMKVAGWNLARRIDGMSRGMYECPRCHEMMSIEWYRNPIEDEAERAFDVCDECGFSRPINSYIAEVFEDENEIIRITLVADGEARKGCAHCQYSLSLWRDMPTHEALERLIFAIGAHDEGEIDEG